MLFYVCSNKSYPVSSRPTCCSHRCPPQENQPECISTSGHMYAHTQTDTIIDTCTHSHVRAHTDETRKKSHTDLGSNFSGAISWKHLTVSVKRNKSSYHVLHLLQLTLFCMYLRNIISQCH